MVTLQWGALFYVWKLCNGDDSGTVRLLGTVGVAVQWVGCAMRRLHLWNHHGLLSLWEGLCHGAIPWCDIYFWRACTVGGHISCEVCGRWPIMGYIYILVGSTVKQYV